MLVAILLVVSYGAYMLYSIAGIQGGQRRTASSHEPVIAERDEALSEEAPQWSWQRATFWLAFASLFVALEGDVLVASSSR